MVTFVSFSIYCRQSVQDFSAALGQPLGDPVNHKFFDFIYLLKQYNLEHITFGAFHRIAMEITWATNAETEDVLHTTVRPQNLFHLNLDDWA